MDNPDDRQCAHLLEDKIKEENYFHLAGRKREKRDLDLKRYCSTSSLVLPNGEC